IRLVVSEWIIVFYVSQFSHSLVRDAAAEFEDRVRRDPLSVRLKTAFDRDEWQWWQWKKVYPDDFPVLLLLSWLDSHRPGPIRIRSSADLLSLERCQRS